MLEGLNEKIRKLIALYETERARSAELSRRLERTEVELAESRTEIDKLNKKIAGMQLSGALGASDGVSPASRERLEKLIGEIDRCIAMLEE